MRYLKKIFAFLFIIYFLSACGLHKRVHLNSENRIAVSPRGYSVKSYKNMDAQKKESIQRRNRIRNITLIVSANALIFMPIILSHHSDSQSEK